MLFHRVVLSALLVGALSGLLLSAVQRWQVIPIIDAAERFEQARTPQAVEPARGEVQAHDHGAHVHSATAWEPAEGAERIGFTVLSNVLTAAGFALIMLVAMAAALRRRDTATQRKAAARLDWRYGLLWGWRATPFSSWHRRSVSRRRFRARKRRLSNPASSGGC